MCVYHSNIIEKQRGKKIPRVEEQLAADSSTRKATLTKRNGKTIPSTSTTGKSVRPGIRRAAGGGAAAAGKVLAAPELDIVKRFIPDAEM